MAQGLGMKVNEEPRVKEVDEKKIIASSRPARKNVEGRVMGSRRIFAPHFKLKVLDSYRQDSDCRGNQRATARKYGIHRRQIQKWLQVESSLRASVEASPSPASEPSSLNLEADAGRQHDDKAAGESRQAMCQHGGPISTGEAVAKRLTHSVTKDDAISDDQQPRREVTVSLFPSVKIEELSMQKEVPINLICDLSLKRDDCIKSLPSIKIEDTVPIEIKEEQFSEDDETSIMSPVESEQALDFTCAALSKRRSFSLQFKLEVLDAFHSDGHCRGNQRATARKFGINRRQVQKWLHQEHDLRGETVSRGGLFRQRLGRWADMEEGRMEENQETIQSADPIKVLKETDDICWDLSNRKRKSVPMNIIPFKKRTVEFLKEQNKDSKHIENVTSSGNALPEIQETALCLVKAKCHPNVAEERSSPRNSEVSSSVDLNRVIGQALYHSNREHFSPPFIHFPIPTLAPNCFLPPPEVGYHDLQHMLSFYRGFVSDNKLRENMYPLDFKLKALDCYHSDGFCRGNQFAVASRFGIDHIQVQKWLKQEDQLRQHNDATRMLNVFR